MQTNLKLLLVMDFLPSPHPIPRQQQEFDMCLNLFFHLLSRLFSPLITPLITLITFGCVCRPPHHTVLPKALFRGVFEVPASRCDRGLRYKNVFHYEQQHTPNSSVRPPIITLQCMNGESFVHHF